MSNFLLQPQNKQVKFSDEQGYKIKLLREKEELAKNFEADKLKEGSGEMKSSMKTKVYVDRSKYKGEFLKGKRHGTGIYYYTNGDIYGGSWKDDVFEGYGFYIFASGERYEGELKHGKKHGKGKYHSSTVVFTKECGPSTTRMGMVSITTCRQEVRIFKVWGIDFNFG